MEFEVFCENVKSLIGKYIEIDNDKIFIKTNTNMYVYTKSEYEKVIKKIKEAKDCYLLMDGYYEVMLDFVDDYSYYYLPGIRRLTEQYGKVYKDMENDIEYSIGYISDEYIITYIMNLKSTRYLFASIRENEARDGKNDFFWLLRNVFRNIKTLKIKTKEKLDVDTYNNYVDSFLYNLTYNNNIVLKRAMSFNNTLRRRGIRRTSEIIIPKRIYNQNLLEQYSIANSSVDPFIQFISYYHILEHFYESVYNEDLINSLRLEMTSPNFSIKNDKNIVKIIEMVKRKTKQTHEEFDINECEALEILLRKNITFGEIKEELEKLGINNIEIYNEKVKFCDGNKLNFHDIKDDNNYKNLAKRIYKTRNALVHYKSDEKSLKELKTYKPFKDKEELFNEIPLIRIIAEKIIINNSTII